MDIQHLKYFAEVAKQLNFTKAALSLHISQPSLSKAIKNIEEELGVPLFYRRSKKLELTDAGKAVLVNAKQVLESFDNLTSELDDMMAFKKGEVKIGIPPIIGAAYFSSLISHFKEQYPKIDIILMEVGTKTIQQGVEEGSIDIGLICNIPVEKRSFEVRPLLKDPLNLIVHRSHPLSKKKTITLNDIKSESFILYRKDFSLYDRIIDECTKHDFSPIVVCESTQKDFMIEMVKAKLGVALLPQQICDAIHLNEIVVVPFEKPSIWLELGLIWKKEKYLPFAVREFVAMTESFLQ